MASQDSGIQQDNRCVSRESAGACAGREMGVSLCRLESIRDEDMAEILALPASVLGRLSASADGSAARWLRTA